MLDYWLRLNAAIFPFVFPVVVIVAVVSFACGDSDYGFLVALIAAAEALGYLIIKFWLGRREEDAAREWQRLNPSADGE